ncbi:hypothetical protein JGU71_20925 [Antrihabitans sp. YC3-6]|uniref:Secreted protein n=1 Tax=Antrihabitans stalagmiti TaxID=2799499 RepID=A0A934NTN5_9NOCA|nr:hypothetical protein [Antrihabitans stalagmiti]MBJ8341353.1 hypothetical protein [Antrihabitans stalagmiti]
MSNGSSKVASRRVLAKILVAGAVVTTPSAVLASSANAEPAPGIDQHERDRETYRERQERKEKLVDPSHANNRYYYRLDIPLCQMLFEQENWTRLEEICR